MATTLLSFQTVLESQVCARCGIQFAMPEHLVDKLRENKGTFYCPNGHSLVFGGRTEADKLRDELKRKEQELSAHVQAKILAQNEADTLRRKLKRVHKGTCPCCKRSFQDLKRHMETKHPELAKATA